MTDTNASLKACPTAIAASLTPDERHDVVHGNCVMSSGECVCKSPTRDKLVEFGLFRKPTSAGGRLRTKLGKQVAAEIKALSGTPPESSEPTASDDPAHELERLRDVLDTERYRVAIGVQAIARAVQGRRWLSQPGRGSYTYDDDRYQQEFGAALSEIEEALKLLSAIAQDWQDCPRDPLRVAANRAAATPPVQS